MPRITKASATEVKNAKEYRLSGGQGLQLRVLPSSSNSITTGQQMANEQIST